MKLKIIFGLLSICVFCSCMINTNDNNFIAGKHATKNATHINHCIVVGSDSTAINFDNHSYTVYIQKDFLLPHDEYLLELYGFKMGVVYKIKEEEWFTYHTICVANLDMFVTR